MLPNHAHTVFCAAELEAWRKEGLSTQSQGGTTLRKYLLGSEKACCHKKVCGYHYRDGSNDTHSLQDISSEPETRSCRVPWREKNIHVRFNQLCHYFSDEELSNKQDHQGYKKGEEVWLWIGSKLGSYPVTIESEGVFDHREQQWKYQLRQTDGNLYENGKLVREDDLNRTQRRYQSRCAGDNRA